VEAAHRTPLRPQVDSQIGAEYSAEIIRQINSLPVAPETAIRAGKNRLYAFFLRNPPPFRKKSRY
jgi:hypothetical protein